MSEIINIKIDLQKVGFKKWTNAGTTYMICPANRFYQGEKGTYLDLVSFLNAERDDYGQDGSVALSRKKEEKDQKLHYVGNMRRAISTPTAKPTDDFAAPGEKPELEQYAEAKQGGDNKPESFDDLPF